MNDTASTSKILIVDDNPANIHVLSDNLKDDYDVIYALEGEEALDTVFSGDRPDLILLDIMMPGMDGYEVCERLKADPDTRDIPIIFITAMDRAEDEAKGLELGAVDYISKPFNTAIVRARISNTLRLKKEMDRRIMLTRQLQELNQNLENRVSEKVAELGKAHENLKESESRYRSVFENAVDGIIQVSNEGRVLNASPSMARILGYGSPEELISSVTDFGSQCYASPDDRRALLHILTRDGVIRRSEARMKKKDGSLIWVSLSARLVCDDRGQILYTEGFCTDTTRQKEAEQALRESENRLRQARKMEAMGTLAAGIAHDFNNILYSMTGYSEMISDSLPPESEEYAYMKEILKAGRRAGELVSQILSFSRQTERARKPVCMKPIVKEVSKLMRSAFPPTIEIEEDIHSDSLISAAPVEIHQVVMNLCTNALHAMRDKGGVLKISLTDTEIPADNTVQGRDFIPGLWVRLKVRDTGCGMNRETVERIFDPYFTTKPKEEGTGLGLATVYGIVRDLGGHISAESEIGKGSTFTVVFPRIEDTGKTGEEDMPDRALPTGQERILLADDEKLICEMLKAMLEGLGYHVTAHISATDALDAFKATPDDFDMVLTDMLMPNLNGLELAEQVMAIRPDIPIIILSGFSNPDNIQKARKLGIREFIMKPVLRSEVSQAIRRALSAPAT